MQKITFAHGGFAKVGGIETFTADLALALSDQRMQTELICWSARGKRENPALQRLSKNGVKIHRTDWRWGCRFGWPDNVMVLQQWKRFVDSDLLVFGKLLHSSAHRRLLPLKKRMILITPYRPAEMWKSQRPSDELLDSLEAIIVQAPVFERDLREFGYHGKVFVLPLPPPDAKKCSPWPATATLHVGFVGRLVPDKNVEYLIRSFSQLMKMGIPTKLSIFGDGPERDNLQSMTNRAGLTDDIQFHGHQDHREIHRAIDSCHVFAFTSRTEGLPIGALEILSRGRPVLGTPVGALPEVLSEPLGSIAPLDDPAAFASALKSMSEPIFSGEITPEGIQQEYCNRFSRQRVINDYLQIFERSDSLQECQQAI
jgi:glycosyltransferase involved in cell wall biosynthesis